MNGELDDIAVRSDELFGFDVPVAVPGVDSILLTPRETWADGPSYDRQALHLAGLFRANFEKFGDAANAAAGPNLAQAAE